MTQKAGMSVHLGIDLGGTSIKMGLVNEGGQIISRLETDTSDDFDTVTRDMAEGVLSLLKKTGLGKKDLPYIGLGVPSTVHPETGRLILANNTGWENAPMREALEEKTGLSVLIANDADCALAGEALCGSAKNQKDVLMLTLGTGVGGAMLINGRLFSGCDGMGMEVGHLPLIAGGPKCTCGASGCVETLVSATGLVLLTKEAIHENPDSLMHKKIKSGIPLDGRLAFSCMEEGDQAAKSVVERYCALLAQTVGGLSNVFRPALVLLGGGVSKAGDALLFRVREALPRFILSYSVIGGPELRLASLGNDAGLIGAAFLKEMSI